MNNLAKISRIPRLYRLVKLLKLVRLVKVAKNKGINKITKFFEEKINFNSHVEKILLAAFSFFLFNHIIACLWMYLARVNDFEPGCWVVRLGYIDTEEIDVRILLNHY